MKLNMPKSEAIAKFNSIPEMADALGISRSAIYQWPDDKPIPEDKALLIRYVLKPEMFEHTAA